MIINLEHFCLFYFEENEEENEEKADEKNTL